MGGGCRPFSTSSESESDEDDELNEDDERHHGRWNEDIKDHHARRTINDAEGERADNKETTGGNGLHKEQVLTERRLYEIS
jgi:hypothetical protein